MLNSIRKKILIVALVSLSLLQGCTTVTHPDPQDPWEGMNRDIFSFNDDVDEYIMKPSARAYQWVMPEFLDVGVTNIFSNLLDAGVSVNNFLQGKVKEGSMDIARLMVNSTVGIAGFFDVATLIDLPKHEEDFGQTMAVWGMPSGPYFVIPFYGPSTVRGVGGRLGDTVLHPLTYTGLFANPVVSWGALAARTVEIIDIRADFLGAEAVASEAALDRYTFFRSAYRQRRQYLINDGAAQALDLGDDDMSDDKLLYEGLE